MSSIVNPKLPILSILHEDNKKMILNRDTKIQDYNNTDKRKIINQIENNNQFNKPKNTSNNIASTNHSNIHQQQSQQLEIARENRLSKIISLYSKGLTQSEIAEKMKVNQSTVSRDLQYLQHEAKIISGNI